MSLAIVRTVIQRFLKESRPQVLVLKGAWGIGKTFAWQSLVKENKAEILPPRYAYASLFGVATIANLKTMLASQIVPADQIGEKISWTTLNENWLDLIKAHWKRVLKILPNKAGDLPILGSVNIPIDGIASYFLNETVICLDDIERSKVPQDELLGFVSSLKEERGSKVVLIFNAEKLSDEAKQSYAAYREKVVDIELEFSPTASEAATLAIPDTVDRFAYVRERAASLGIRNIRVLKRIVDLLRLLTEHMEGSEESIAQQVISTTVLMSWVQYGEPSTSKPTVDFIRNWAGGLPADAPAGENSPARLWTSTLHAYGYAVTDDLDLAIEKVIGQGYVEGSGFAEMILERKKDAAGQRLVGEFSNAWDEFHFSFADNQEAVIRDLDRSFRNAVMLLSPLDLNATVGLLRDLNHEEQADSLIEFYIDQRRGEAKLFNIAEQAFGFEIKDQQVRRRFEEIHQQNLALPNLYDAVVQSMRNQSWSALQQEAMNKATQEDFLHILRERQGRQDLGDFLRACNWQSKFADHADFRAKFHSALATIGATSQLNAVRVGKYGVTIQPRND